MYSVHVNEQIGLTIPTRFIYRTVIAVIYRYSALTTWEKSDLHDNEDWEYACRVAKNLHVVVDAAVVGSIRKRGGEIGEGGNIDLEWVPMTRITDIQGRQGASSF